MKNGNAMQMTLEAEIVKAALINGATFGRSRVGNFETAPASVRQFIGAAVERAARLGLLTDAELARTEFAENRRREAARQEREALERERTALVAELSALEGADGGEAE